MNSKCWDDYIKTNSDIIAIAYDLFCIIIFCNFGPLHNRHFYTLNSLNTVNY